MVVAAARIEDVTSKIEEAILETEKWDRRRVYAVDWNNSDIIYRSGDSVRIGTKIESGSMVSAAVGRIANLDKEKRVRIVDAITGFNYPLARSQVVISPGFLNDTWFEGKVYDIGTIKMLEDGVRISSDTIERERIMSKSRDFEVWYGYSDGNNDKVAKTVERCDYLFDVMNRHRGRILPL